MNIEIANRLVNLRKANSFSQEALAEKLGISRQAVSKWERAEASPDTDNLILLARLYGVSLDELLSTDEEIPRFDQTSSERISGMGSNSADAFGDDGGRDRSKKEEYVHIGLSGVHVKDKDGSEVHVGWKGIHVDDRKSSDRVDIDTNGVFVNGEQYDHKWFMKEYRYKFPFALLIVVAYLIMGSFFELWHPGWLIFLFIPIWYSFVEAIHKKNANIFAYPVVAVLLFLVIGFYWQAWHPGWVIFLSIPLYYSFIVYLKGMADERSKTGADDRVGYDNQTVNGDQVSKEDQAIDNDRADVDEK